MRIKKDLSRFIKENIEYMVESHLDIWKDRYYRMRLSDIINELGINFDYSGDLEYVSEAIGREITLDEQCYYIKMFERTLKKEFYK